MIVLFGGFEMVERAWFEDASKESLHLLHLLRGISAAAIAATLAVTLLLRQLQRPAHGAAGGSWQHTVQRVRLRTKIVVPVTSLAVGPALVVGFFAVRHAQEALHAAAMQRVEFDTGTKARALEGFFQAVQEDLRFLSQMGVVRDLATAEARDAPEEVARLRREAEQEFAVFSQGKRAYYQVRYLNRAGHEVVRLNVERGRPAIVPLHQLQDKGNRYYVRAAATVAPGEIYVSPVDLNVEHGLLEEPPRRVVRYATPVTGATGRERGLLVINIFADHLLSFLGPLPRGAEALLVDEARTPIGYLGAGNAGLDTAAAAQLWQLAKSPLSVTVAPSLAPPGAQPILKTKTAFLCRAAVPLTGAAPDRALMLMIAYPRGPLETPIRHLTVFIWGVLALVVGLAAMSGVLLAHYLARPVGLLRQATREVADGDLSRRVEINTGDEIEELANDFNVMTGRLEEARRRLATWNEELAREVALQTAEIRAQAETIRELQGGMARTDKLASIGQVAAGVMHEIGNPLAAIKTKIQLAGRISDLGREQRALLAEILGEVDRLAAFLRSFSRLTRLRDTPLKKHLALAAVAESVIALLSPDLRRRQVALRVETVDDAPSVRGDADQLRQLIMNLILNAADASPNGGEVIVKILRPAGGGATLEVWDRGAGIPAGIRDRIWNPFFTTKPEGTGLGLAISRQIVQQHAGTIQIQSEPGAGTVVTVTFPNPSP